ncbi:hypothetical protein LTR04_006930 [Oleoguttula sp. CCFEE 6159]|nr:hypothetical protein LTR04_006930 [Oleoguttula sp. CCFEE 6159]
MHPIIRPLFRPVPLIGLTTTTFVAALAIASRPSSSMSSSHEASSSWPTKPYIPRYQNWPYTARDFARQDESTDTDFYSAPRFVTHIDDHAIQTLRSYYETVLPRRGRVLDFCSSWISHYPAEVEEATRSGELTVVGLGMNKAELDANPVLRKENRLLADLNVQPKIPDEAGNDFDAATCVVSIDYMTKPKEVLESLKQRTKEGGMVHLIISNRCFPTKAVGRWLRVGEEERLNMVGDYLHFAGWKNIEIVDLSSAEEGREPPSGIAGLMQFIGMGGHDPLWVVRGRNTR